MAKKMTRRVRTLSERNPHPYLLFQGTPLWKAVEKGVSDLIENQDLIEKTNRGYIVGYICKVITRRKGKIAAQFSR